MVRDFGRETALGSFIERASVPDRVLYSRSRTAL